MSTLVDRAEAAARWYLAGWAPLPIPANAKGPPPPGTTGKDGQDLSGEELRQCNWRGNVAVRMAEDSIGLDVDDHDDKPGARTLAELIERLGPLPPTYRSSNGRPGLSGIRFYRVPVGLTWIAGLPGIDIIQRGHRYAVVWPSMHPEGRQYVLIEEASGESCEVPALEDLPELPWPWIAYLTRTAEGETTSHAVDLDGLDAFLTGHVEAEEPGYVSAIVAHFVDRVDNKHSRHDSMQHALTWAMESAAAGLVSAREAIKALHEAWVPVHTDPRRIEAFSTRRTTEFDAMVRHAVGKATAKTEAELVRIHDKVALPPIGIASLEPEPVEASAEGGLYLDWSSVWGQTMADHEWLAEGMWPRGRAIALWAPAKTGKSELALWIAVQLAVGRDPFTGAAIDPVHVLYLDYEMSLEDVLERLEEFGYGGRHLDHLHYALLPPLPGLDTDEGGRMVEGLVLEVGAQAVVIDTFGRAVGGDEDKADTVRAFYRFTGSRLKRLSVGYLRTDHAGKDMTKGQRGSSAKRDDVDIVWLAKRTLAGVTLDCTGSSRLSWVGPVLVLDRTERPDGVAYRAVEDASVVVVTEAVAAKVKHLDDLGIPLDWGRPRVIAELRSKGEPVGGKAVLGDALKARKGRGQLDGA